MKDLLNDINSYDGLPSGFIAEEQGIYAVETRGDEVEATKRLCSPLRVVSSGCRTDRTGWGHLVELKDPSGDWHQVYVPKQASGQAIVAILQGRGLSLSTGIPRAAQKLKALIDDWAAPTNTLFIEKLGWVDGNFDTFAISPNNIVGQRNAFFVGGHISGYQGPQGTLTGWQSEIGVKCVGNPILTVAVCVALAGPFVRPIGNDNFLVHLQGASSSGKTTALYAANSVWGDPSQLRTWRTTSNALEVAAATSSDMLLALDEFGQISAAEAGEAAYMIGNGVGKQRGRADGGTAPGHSWTLCALSTGELSLAEKLSQHGRRAMEGQEVRFLDIEADGRMHGIFDELHGFANGSDLSNHLKAAATRNYGVAGEHLAGRLVQLDANKRKTIRSLLERCHQDLLGVCEGETDGPTQRVAKSFALLAAAGEVATHCGVTGWQRGDASRAVRTVFGIWRQTKTRLVAHICAGILEFLEEHPSRLQHLNGPEIPDRIGYEDSDHIYLSPASLSLMVSEGEPGEAARLLASAGVLHRDGRHLKRKMPRRIQKRTRHYKLSRSKLFALGDSALTPT